MNDVLPEGLTVFITGMMIVFLVLLILWFFLHCMQFVFYRRNVFEENKGNKENKKLPSNEDEDNEEIIAVLTAAVAAVSAGSICSNFEVKAFRKIANTNTVWSQAGLMDVINSRF